MTEAHITSADRSFSILDEERKCRRRLPQRHQELCHETGASQSCVPAATHRQDQIGPVLEKLILSHEPGLQDVLTTRQRLEPDSTKN